MSLHHFEIHIAQKYGVNVAIFLNNLAYWIEQNIADNSNFNDGTWWSYKTQKAFTVLFPYWTRQNMRTIIQTCISEGLLKTGNYNKNQYDQTIWYALTDKGWELFPRLETAKQAIGWNQPIKGLESTNEMVGTNQPIPNNATDNTKDNKSSCRPTPKKAKSQKPKTRKDHNNEEKHHWAANAKVCDPITKDATICSGCKRPSHEGSCENNGRLPKELAAKFSKMALARLTGNRTVN